MAVELAGGRLGRQGGADNPLASAQRDIGCPPTETGSSQQEPRTSGCCKW